MNKVSPKRYTGQILLNMLCLKEIHLSTYLLYEQRYFMYPNSNMEIQFITTTWFVCFFVVSCVLSQSPSRLLGSHLGNALEQLFWANRTRPHLNEWEESHNFTFNHTCPRFHVSNLFYSLIITQ